MNNLDEQTISNDPQPAREINRIVNGKRYRVRLFFPEHSKESLKTKYERLLRNKLLDELSRNPINA